MMNRVLFAAVIMSFLNSANADDLLNILEGRKSETLIKEEKSNNSKNYYPDLLNDKTAEQQIFFDFLNNENYTKALYQWRSAFADTKFATTENGMALHALILLKNNLEMNGLEKLFQIKTPEKIAPSLKTAWKLAAPKSLEIWKWARLNWTPGWSEIFGTEIEVFVQSNNMTYQDSGEKIENLLKKTQPDTQERAWILWQYVLNLAASGDVTKSAQFLRHLIETKVKVQNLDQLNMTAGRLLFEKGYLQPAIDYYAKVPKSSDFWFEAQEEIAWSYIRKGEPQNALAHLQTIGTPTFKNLVGPEAIFLKSLTHLKVCDYTSVIQTVQDFKSRFMDRTLALEKLSLAPSEASRKAIDLLTARKISYKDLAKDQMTLPRHVARDETLYRLAQTHKVLRKESIAAADLYSKSLSGGTDKVGFAGELEKIKIEAEARSFESKNLAIERIEKLAKEEVEETKQIIKKLQIVEVEVIQQAGLAQRIVKAEGALEKKQGKDPVDGKYLMRFPFEGEFWLDEAANYKVDISKACQAKGVTR